MKFKVQRKKWARGGRTEKYGETALLNEQGNMCCLGFVCQQLGATKAEINKINLPSGSSIYPKFQETFRYDYCFEDLAAEINDDSDLTDTQRTRELKKLFKEYGHEIEFVS